MPGTTNAVLTPAPVELFFRGRPGDLRLGEWIGQNSGMDSQAFSLVGCPDDTGVTLNRGRAGAAQGPNEIRRAFYKMTLPLDGSWNKFSLRDRGNIPVSKDIHTTHQKAFEASEFWAKNSQGLLLLGGGHDFAAPGFLGFMSGRSLLNPKASFGLVNIDPHLDVRELEENKPHSGTPFRQILESGNLKGSKLIQFGFRENRNSRSHFEFCKQNGVQLIPLEKIRSQGSSPFKFFKQTVSSLLKKVTDVGVTLDMDSCSEVIGTSAAPGVGFTVSELYEFAYWSGSQKSIRYFEIAEVAPKLDPSGKTAVSAAEILYAFLLGKARYGSSSQSQGKSKISSKTLKKPKNRSKAE